MRGYCYGVDDGSGWSWRVSVSLDADLAWWATRGIKRIWVRTRVRMSLGQAFEWAEEQQREGRTVIPVDEGEWVPCSSRGEARVPLSGYRRLIEALEGRCLLREEMEPFLAYHGLPEDEATWLYYVQRGAMEGTIRIRHGVEREKKRRGLFRVPGKIAYRCVRCGCGEDRLHRTPCPHCGTDCPYCEACLTMGRVRFCGLLVQGLRRGGNAWNITIPSQEEVTKRWSLSPAQSDAAWQALRFLKEERPSRGHSFLLWAVTGAGKTEMMFPLAEHALRSGRRVLIATPRKDVVLELQPRIQAAFPANKVVTLYGGSRERWECGDITLATTHQLFRFREAFDLVVVDEIDAFPFHGDEQLLHAARAVCAENGRFILLSATPPKQLRLLAESGRLPHAKVCVRFHRHPLPVPQRIRIPALRRFTAASALPVQLLHAMRSSIERGAQLFVFVPHIESIPGLVRMIRSAFPHVSVEGTSSKDAERLVKVEHFRGKNIRIIVTTTILERGVTVPKTDVFIIDADSPLFDDASLIQMAGRAGRKLEDPQGNVYFCAADWTKGQRDAVRQIRDMNALARKKGYLVS